MTIEIGLLAVIAVFTVARWFTGSPWGQLRWRRIKRALRLGVYREKNA
jgi:hypothetical protein